MICISIYLSLYISIHFYIPVYIYSWKCRRPGHLSEDCTATIGIAAASPSGILGIIYIITESILSFVSIESSYNIYIFFHIYRSIYLIDNHSFGKAPFDYSVDESPNEGNKKGGIYTPLLRKMYKRCQNITQNAQKDKCSYCGKRSNLARV